MYHDSIRQHEAKLQNQYDTMHHGDGDDSDEPADDDDAFDEADDAEPPEGADETAAIEGGNSLGSSASDVVQPLLAASDDAPRLPRPACPAPAEPARSRRQLTISGMFGGNA